MNKKFFVIMMCCSLAVLMCCCLSVYGAFSLKCPSCGSTRVRTYTQSSANGHVATTVCNKCNTVVLRGNVVAHKWNTLHTCTVCGYRGSHRYSAKVLKEATCTSEGVRKYTCECGAEFEEKLVMLKHVFIYQNGTKNEKTHLLNCKNCTATRNETHKMSNNRCTVCGYEEVTVQVCSHVWKAATCTTPKTCTKCGETEGEALGHSYKYNGGLKTGNTHRLVCERCNASRTETHKMSNNKCTVCGYEKIIIEEPKKCSHKYIYSNISEEKHSVKCTKCDYYQEENHEFNSSNRCKKCYATRKCNKDYTVPGHPIFVDKYEMTNDAETHKVTKRCVACNITFEYTEKHSFNIDGVCVSCGYKNAIEQKCKLGRILEGHNPVKTEKQTKIDSKVHRIYYYCDICDRTFSENVSHTFVNGICSCGYTEDDFVCQHDSKNYKITYSKTNDINKHIKKIVCKECNAQVEIREGHTFLNKKCECGVEFSMRIQMDTTSLAKGETVQIKVIHNGDSNITFGYTSSNTNLIEVNDSGLVKAVEDSNISNRGVTITVKAYAGNRNEIAKQTINMKYSPGYALNVNIPSQAYLGEEVELTAIASKDIGDGYIKWNIEGVGDINQVKDSNSIKCIFNKAGQIKCQVTIYKNSSAVARETRTVKVIERKTKTPTREMSIFLDDSVILANIENLTIEDGNSVKVSGNAVTGVSLGVTRVKDEKGNTYNINVTNKIIPITDIKIELGRTDNIIFKDEQVQANIITIPQNATEEITIKSSNSSIPVTNGGLITAKSVGKTTITISTPSGKKIEQKIEVKAEDLKLEGKKGKIEVDLASKTINLPVDKSLLSEKTLSTLKYTSSNNEIATVSDDGVVKLLKMGNVTIKVNATLLNGKTTKEVKQKISIMNYTRVKFVKDGKNYGYDMKAGTDENSNKIYVYFGGSGSITGGVNASANEKIKDSTYSGDVLVAMGTGDIGTFAEWDPTIPAMAELLSSDKYADKEIILIGYSSGGYSAAETALGLAEKGKTNVTLYIVDGVQGARGKNQFEEYEKLDAAGVDTTIYSSSDTRDISKNTRAVGEEFAKKKGSNIKYVKDEDNMSHGDIKDFAQDLIDK